MRNNLVGLTISVFAWILAMLVTTLVWPTLVAQNLHLYIFGLVSCVISIAAVLVIRFQEEGTPIN